jgi:hypothetical protein
MILSTTKSTGKNVWLLGAKTWSRKLKKEKRNGVIEQQGRMPVPQQ